MCASLTSPLWGDRHAAKMVGRALLLRYTLGGLCTTFERLQYLPRNFSDLPASVQLCGQFIAAHSCVNGSL